MRAPDPIEDVFRALGEAVAALRRARQAWDEAVVAERFEKSDHLDRAEALLDEITHDLCSEIELGSAELRSQVARLRLRARFAVFTDEEIEGIVAGGWSTELLRALAVAHPGLSLEELSGQVREIVEGWDPVRR